MNLILCMAGLYKRFKEANYQLPKYLLPWQNETILSCILKNMLADGAFSQVLLIANKRDKAYQADIEKILNTCVPITAHLHFIEDTLGQAETAFKACEWLKQLATPEKRVIFHNIDTILLGRNYRQYGLILQNYAGLIDVFRADSPAFSYVALDSNCLVTRIAEKIVISNHATTGLYGFSSYENYLKYYPLTRYSNEYYISDIYQCMLQHNEKIYVPEVASQHTLVLGTPAEYENAYAQYN